MELSKSLLDSKIAIVIPTLNRHERLLTLLNALDNQDLSPSLVIVVDASEEDRKYPHTSFKLIPIHSTNKSAAQQRNIGLDWLSKQAEYTDICLFIDDDVVLERSYIRRVSSLLLESQAIGVSGIAVGKSESFTKNSFFFNLLGITGSPGSVTKAAINIPVRNNEEPLEAEWLIGCSAWKYPVISDLRFQRDFEGQSIFEDVLFSIEASKRGELIVDSTIKFRHDLDESGRPDRRNYFAQWISNRYRLRQIDRAKFSLFRFLLANLAFGLKTILIERDISAFLGVIEGHLRLVRKR
jgi:glycosyltransferase involved in cell wall biosynthesis